MSIAQKLKLAKEKQAAANEKLLQLRTKATGGTWDIDKDGAAQESAETELRNATLEADQMQRLMNNEEEQLRANSGGTGANGDGNAPAPITANYLPGGRKPDTTKRHKQEFRLLKACRQSISGALDGIEAEVCQEGARDIMNVRAGFTNGLILPPYMVENLERRDLTAGSGTSMGNLIATELASEMVPFLDPQMPIRTLGARFNTGLVGNIDFVRKTARATATWKTENAAASEVTNTTDKISMTPNRLPAFTEVSEQLLQQTSFNVENDVRMDLNQALALALEAAAINGSGTAPEPEGILNTSGIGSVALGTNGAVPAWDNLVALETALANANAIANSTGQTIGYLTTPGVAGLLKGVKRDVAGNGFIWEGPNYPFGTINGYRAATSTLVPSTLTKGTASAICHAIIMGVWSELMIGQWGGVQIIVNPYSRDTEALVRITVNSYWDIAVRHVASFAAIKDALLS